MVPSTSRQPRDVKWFARRRSPKKEKAKKRDVPLYERPDNAHNSGSKWVIIMKKEFSVCFATYFGSYFLRGDFFFFVLFFMLNYLLARSVPAAC